MRHEDANTMEIGKRYIVAGVSGALVYAILCHAPFAIVGMQVAVEAALPVLFTLAIGIGIGAVSRGRA